MVLVDYSGDYKASTTLTVQYSNPLVDHEDVIDGVPASLVPSGATNGFYNHTLVPDFAKGRGLLCDMVFRFGWFATQQNAAQMLRRDR